jgi:hypothetical protein
MTDFEAQVLGDLRVLRNQMDALMGVGQPGRLVHLEERVDGHERGLQRIKGFVAASGTLLTVLHLAIDYFCR